MNRKLTSHEIWSLKMRERNENERQAKLRAAAKAAAKKKLPPMEHPEGEPIVGAMIGVECERCHDSGWLPAIEGRDGSYITSRPCSCSAGRNAGAAALRVPDHVPSTYGPGGEVPIDYVAYQSKKTAEVQAQADVVKKRGRPKSKTAEERKAYRAEWARKQRAKERKTGE
jgi:hypothetical protein